MPFDDLSERQHAERALLSLAAFGLATTRAAAERHRRSKQFPDYLSLHAVDGGRVVGQLGVLRFPYAFRDGIETVAGLAGVATHPGRARQGVARALLEEAHAREESEGIRHVTLWTNSSWGAHRLYEQYGYRDVHSPAWAVHAGEGPPIPGTAARRAPAGPVRVRPGRPADVPALERLYAAYAKNRLGFRRWNDSLGNSVRAGRVDPARDLRVAERGVAPLGYVHVSASPDRTICSEMVAAAEPVRRALLRAVSDVAGGGVWAFHCSPVADHPELFPKEEFALSPVHWWTFMARDRGSDWERRAAVRRFATADPRFLCLGGDRF